LNVQLLSCDDAKRLAAAKRTAKLRLIDGMNHVLKHATLPAEQQAAYTDPPLPIEAQAVEEITAFLITEIGNAAGRPHPAKGTDVNRRPGSSTTTLINISQSGHTVQKNGPKT
jgi:hypothetical protein